MVSAVVPYELPEGWRWKRVGDVADVTGGGTPRRVVEEYYEGGNIAWATPTDIDPERILPLRATKTLITEEGLRRSSARLLPLGTVLFSSRASIGKIAVADIPIATNQGFANLTPTAGIDSWFLAYALKAFTREVAALGSGTTFVEVAKSSLREFLLPVPPLPEQQRLVEKIERLLKQSRTAREALDRIPPLLKRFRQSVLAKAFRGELTERNPTDEPASVLLERIREERRRKWEENLHAKGKDSRKAKYVEPEPPVTRGLPNLPDGWAWTSLGDVIELLQYGSSVKAVGEESSGVPIIRMGNIQDGGFNLKSLKYVHESSEEIPRYLLQEDDILINRTNSPELVGKAARWKLDGEYIFASYLIRLRADTRIITPSYLIHVINSETSKGHIAHVRHQVAGQSNINSHDIRGIPVPLAPPNEQRRIAAKVEALFAQAHAIEQPVAKALRRAENVDQAVLARAFRGEL